MAMLEYKDSKRDYTEESCKLAVNALSAKYFNAIPEEALFLGGGSFGMAYRVRVGGENKVVKLFKVSGMHRTQAVETETLAGHCLVSFPRTLFIHDEDGEIPFDALGMEFMDGITCIEASPFKYSKKKRLSLASSLAEALRGIHSVKGEKYGLIQDAKYDTWFDFYRPIVDKVYNFVVEEGEDKRHRISPRMAKLVEYSYENFDRIFEEPIGEPTLIHADLNVCNIMVDTKTLELKSIIDPWRTMYADVDFELHQLFNQNGDSYYLYDTYKKKYKTSETVDLKTAFYALYNEIECYMLSGACYAYVYPRMVKNLERQLKRFFGVKLK